MGQTNKARNWSLTIGDQILRANDLGRAVDGGSNETRRLLSEGCRSSGRQIRESSTDPIRRERDHSRRDLIDFTESLWSRWPGIYYDAFSDWQVAAE
jgi:hypothetical protein